MTTGTHPALRHILPPEDRHIVQFDRGKESFIMYPPTGRDRDDAERILLSLGIRNYTVRTRTHAVDETGALREQWTDVRNSGTYAERSGPL